MADFTTQTQGHGSIIDKSVCVRLDISIWTAKAKLNREDLPDTSALPPEELASLGSKRLFDPAKLRPFGALKTRAVTFMDRNGVKFLGGWLIDENLVGDVCNELASMATEFQQALSVFVADYASGVQSWLDAYPQWATVLANAMPSIGDIPRRFNFTWQMYKIAPVSTAFDNANNNSISTEIAGISDKCLQEVNTMLSNCYKQVFDGKAVTTERALRPLRTVCHKLDALAFAYPRLRTLKNLLAVNINSISGNTDDQVMMRSFKSFLRAMMNPGVVASICAQVEADELTTGEAIAALTASEFSSAPVVEPEPVDEEPVVVDDPAPVQDDELKSLMSLFC